MRFNHSFKLGKRAISLALALELFCAPVAMAYATEEADERREKPVVDENVLPQDAPLVDGAPAVEIPGSGGASAADGGSKAVLAESDGPTPFAKAEIAYGVELDSSGYLKKYQSNEADEGFSVSVEGTDERWLRGSIDKYSDVLVHMYAFFPDPNGVGRIPDMTWEGYYIFTPKLGVGRTFGYSDLYREWQVWSYGSAETGTAGEWDPVNWNVDTHMSHLSDSELAALKVTLYEGDQALTDDHRAALADDNKVPVSVPFTRSQVRQWLEIDDDSDDVQNGGMVRLPASYANMLESSARLPVVARWVKSSKNEMTHLGLSSGGDKIETVYKTDIFRRDLSGTGTTLTYGSGASLSGFTNSDWQDVQTTVEKEVDGETVTETVDTQEIWVRLPEEKDSIDLTLEVYEPYCDYFIEEGQRLSMNETLASTGITMKDVTYTHTVENGGVSAPADGNDLDPGMTLTVPSPVQVSAAFGDAALTVGNLTGMITPFNQVIATGDLQARNSEDNAARSLWTVSVSGLKKAQGEAQYNDITIQVTAPDGEHVRTYIIHVERETALTSGLGYGNTPAGLIAGNNDPIWEEYNQTVANWVDNFPTFPWSYSAAGSAAERSGANRAYALEWFKGYHKYHEALYPRNGGMVGTFRNTYSADAWEKPLGLDIPEESWNYDLDENAVVVYQDSAFVDPGVFFTDSEGKAVVFGSGATGDNAPYANSVKRTIALKTADSLTVDLYTDPSGADTRWYVGAGGDASDSRLNSTELAQTLTVTGGGDVVDLRGINVVPGIYEIKYTYTDPYDTSKTETIKRNLIVLPIPGDVDMDGAVTMADAVELSKNRTAWASAGAGGSKIARLVSYRCFDLDGNGSITDSTDPEGNDAKIIYGGFQPQWVRGDGSDYYYPKLSEGSAVSTYSRKAWEDVAVATGKGTLTLKYLGVEMGTRDTSGTYIDNAEGPWGADANHPVELLKTPREEDARDTFWMGVTLDVTNSALKNRAVTDFSITLIYDDRYVEPTSTLSRSAAGYGTAEDRWKTTVIRYNLDDEYAQTVWKDNDYQLTAATTMARAYDVNNAHYSKVISQLETDLSHDESYSTTSLRELVFSVHSDTPVTFAGEEVVLAVPFRLKAHPPGRGNETTGEGVRLVELGAGMRDFNVVTTAPVGGASIFGTFATLFSSFFSLSDGAKTAAYSTQTSIYGSATDNLREEVGYDNGAASYVLLGANNTKQTEMLNVIKPGSPCQAEYDTPFEGHTNRGTIGGTVDKKDLPPGLEYEPALGVVTGTPTQAGKYVFTIKGEVYTITVRPRTLRYYAESKSTYYGQPELRGYPSQQPKGKTADGSGTLRPNQVYTYKYYVDDIADRDLQAYGITKGWITAGAKFDEDARKLCLGKLTGAGGDELQGVLNDYFEEPTFVVWESPGKPVSASSPAGLEGSTNQYRIVNYNDVSTTNYIFEYVTETPEGDNNVPGQLDILRRPVLVDYIIADEQVTKARIYHDDGPRQITGLNAGGEFGGLVKLTIPADAQDTYNDIPLWGSPARDDSEITATFYGRFKLDPVLDNETSFVITGSEAIRQLEVTDISLTGTCAGNYDLRDTDPKEVTGTCSVKGTVVRRAVTSIDFRTMPKELEGGYEATYGDKISQPYLLRVAIRKGNNVIGDYQYDQYSAFGSDDLIPLGVHFNWVTEAEMTAGLADPSSLVGTGRAMADGKGLDGNPATHPDGSAILKGDDLRGFNVYQNGYLTPDMSGMYLCVSASKYSDAGEEYFKVYSEHHLTVLKKDLLITPKSLVRYYGENNGGLTYTYAPEGLADLDKNRLGDRADGTKEELEALLAGDSDFQANPIVMTAITSDEDGNEVAVTAATDVGLPCTIRIGEGQSTNYRFRYRQTVGESQGWDYRGGTASLTIQPRPIMVDTVTAPGDNFATIYADTKKVSVTQSVLAGQGKGVAKASLSTNAGGVTFRHPVSTPVVDGMTTISYWVNGIETTAKKVTADYIASNAVLTADLPDLEVKYELTYMPDNGNEWQSFTSNFFDIEGPAKDNWHPKPTDGWSNGERDVWVEVNNLVLSGSKAGNYELVYLSDHDSNHRIPAGSVDKQGPYYNETIARTETDHLFRVVKTGSGSLGTGTVKLRPIRNQGLELTHLGRMQYTYGDPFSPNEFNEGDRVPMTIHVEYETEFDNYSGNVTEGFVEYRMEPKRDETGNITMQDRFTLRGFTLYYVTEDQMTGEQADGKRYLTASAIADYKQHIAHQTDPAQPDSNYDWEAQKLTYAQYIEPGRHNGTHLLVVGRRGENDPLVFSQVTKAVLQVSKRPITLTVVDVHRYYGESNTADAKFTYNGHYTFQTLTSSLAPPDQAGLGTYATEADLEKKLPGYKAPVISDGGVTAVTTVNTEKGYGDYPLTISYGGKKQMEWANYTIENMVDGHIYIYPRPITGNGVDSGGLVDRADSSTYDNALPVYTIYSGTGTGSYNIQLATSLLPGETERATAKLKLDSAIVGANITCADGVDRTLPVAGSNALVGSDRLILDATVTYDQTDLTGGKADQTVKATTVFKTLMASETARNYAWRSSNQPWDSYAALKLRTIKEIHIAGAPKLQYTYGESLDLSTLQVEVFYYTQTGATERVDKVNVAYRGYQDFKSYGLYVNYWDPSKPIPGDSNNRKTLVLSNRAETGNHITIAPDHTSGFVANGKVLIISAFQEGSNQEAAVPKIVGELSDGYYEGAKTPIEIAPRKLTYTLSATDKVYDGDTQTAGTLTLTNIYQTGGVTDAVYVPVGAGYESASDNWADFAALTDSVTAGRVSFTTGVYTPSGEAPLENNGGITWSNPAKYDLNKGYLEFHFTNPNVHYADGYYTNGRPGLGTGSVGAGGPSLTAYWAANQSENSVKGVWDTYNAVSAMPVEVTNMKIMGPDAANYTWDAPESAGQRARGEVENTSVKVATRSAAAGGQAAAPFATIQKANRSTIQALQTTLRYPTLEIDRNTNVVYLNFLQALSQLANNRNPNRPDDYRDAELHFEYALFYQDPESKLYTQWAGYDGMKSFQDTQFFGGEAVSVVASTPAGYYPNADQLPKEENKNENTVYKGQIYRWASLDTGVSEKGYRDNDGFQINTAAYPGGASYRDNYWFYDLYTTNRAALPRDVVYYPLVRLAETHNYNASGCITGIGGVSADQLDKVQKAVNAYLQSAEDATLKSKAKSLSDALFNTACAPMTQDAKSARTTEMDYYYDLGVNNQWPDTPKTAEEIYGIRTAVKTYQQRIDLISSAKVRSGDSTDNTDYVVKTLEAVWFTDTLDYKEQKLLEAMIYNHPVRYYGYYFDEDMSAQITFSTDKWLSLVEKIEGIAIRQPIAGGGTMETTMDANIDHTLEIYVKITSDDSSDVQKMVLFPSALNLRLGDAPVKLEVITYPEDAYGRYRWESSNRAVVTVNENGLVVVRGIGTAIVTVRSDGGKTATCVITVSEASIVGEDSKFNRDFRGSFMEVAEDGNFYPKSNLTRGEFILILDMFCRPDEIWPLHQEMAYVDINRKERYAEALQRLTTLGVVEGMPSNTFEGEREATRAELITAIARFVGLEIIDTRGMPHAFRDAGENDTWAYAYIDAMSRAGLIKGTGGGLFRPKDLTTREEVAAILARLITIPAVTEGNETKKPKDVPPENWSYEAILRAINHVEMPTPDSLKPTYS